MYDDDDVKLKNDDYVRQSMMIILDKVLIAFWVSTIIVCNTNCQLPRFTLCMS